MKTNQCGILHLRETCPARVCWVRLLIATLPALLPAMATAQNISMDEIEQAVLAENWEHLTEHLLKDVNERSADPVLRLIKGHACLATNRNNQSLALFASVLNDDDRTAWQTWADRVATKHPDNAIAWYSKGDAHARRKEWKAAADCFDRAIELNSQCYLALNARGVVAHAVGNTLMARVYFVKAAKAKEDFADAYANRGILNLGGMASARGGGPEEFFKRAQLLSQDGPRNAVALSGLGCVWFGKKDDTEAQRYFDAIPPASRLSLVAARNILIMELRRLAKTIDEAEEAGMTVRVQVAGQQHPVILHGFPWESGAPTTIPPDLVQLSGGRAIESIHLAADSEGGPIIIHERDCTITIWEGPGTPIPDPPDNDTRVALRGGLETVIAGSVDLNRSLTRMAANVASRRDKVVVQQRTWIAAGSPGGATTAGIKILAGRWDARTVYGLLYDAIGEASTK
ncbi:MAG: tetratricopeptide repeat protein [Pirellulaceae bacterium]|nr:tetratricopeptide repeat protein [Pirellulaceae bacterium]